MSKEVELARKIIVAYLGSIDDTEAIKEAGLIGMGEHDDILLEHIGALINIFTRAKNFLENEAKNSEIEK